MTAPACPERRVTGGQWFDRMTDSAARAEISCSCLYQVSFSGRQFTQPATIPRPDTNRILIDFLSGGGYLTLTRINRVDNAVRPPGNY